MLSYFWNNFPSFFLLKVKDASLCERNQNFYNRNCAAVLTLHQKSAQSGNVSVICRSTHSNTTMQELHLCKVYHSKISLKKWWWIERAITYRGTLTIQRWKVSPWNCGCINSKCSLFKYILFYISECLQKTCVSSFPLLWSLEQHSPSDVQPE